MSENSRIQWTLALSVSYTLIDDQHRELIDHLARLHASIEKSDMILARQALEDFIGYTHMHFAEEEVLMRESRYPKYLEHVLRHESLLEEIRQLKKNVDAGKVPLSLALLGYLQVWLFEHIKTADRQLGEYLNAFIAEKK